MGHSQPKQGSIVKLDEVEASALKANRESSIVNRQ
jgi:hypothetical protein